MSRDSSGTYDLPLPDVVAGDTIEASWANTTLTDLETEMTDSLSRSGKGGMTAALKLAAGTVSAPGVAFSSETNSGFYRAGAGDIRMALAGAEAWRMTSAGLRVASTDIIMGTGGKGIDFSAQTPTAATGATTTAEIFKHYEEGTWTPNLWDSSADSGESQTYTTQRGTYTRIGNMVFFEGYLLLSNKGTLSSSGVARIGPLPFTAGSGSSLGWTINFGVVQGVTYDAAGTFLRGMIQQSTNYILLGELGQSGATATEISQISNTSIFQFSGMYHV